ncbi:MAG: flagellar basal body P-ring formation chaperone FlgA [bacterium]|nr:flagellar basal body P-ring formation chaperone FlgA [bacterium]
MKLITMAFCFAAMFGGEHGGGETGNGGDDKNKKKATLDVRVRVGATARGTDVTVAELCEITPITRDSLELGKLVFSPAPIGGRARTVTRTEIVQTIAAAGHDVSRYTFSGPTEIVVQPVLLEVPHDEMLEVATATLQALLAVEGGDVEIETPSRLRRVQTPPGRNDRRLEARVRGGRTGPTSAVVDINVIIDGKPGKRIPVQFKLQRYHMLLKTAGVIRKGTLLGPQNLRISREPIAQSTGLYLTQFDEVHGMIAARNLQANSRITLGDTAPPAVVRKGEIVTIVLTQGRVKVTAKAIANHDAPMAGRITLTNMRSRGTLSGVVAAPGLVVIQN